MGEDTKKAGKGPVSKKGSADKSLYTLEDAFQPERGPDVPLAGGGAVGEDVAADALPGSITGINTGEDTQKMRTLGRVGEVSQETRTRCHRDEFYNPHSGQTKSMPEER